jgi:hypothetical protein
MTVQLFFIKSTCTTHKQREVWQCSLLKAKGCASSSSSSSSSSSLCSFYWSQVTVKFEFKIICKVMFWLTDGAYLAYNWRDSGKLWNTSVSTVCGLNEVKIGHCQNKDLNCYIFLQHVCTLIHHQTTWLHKPYDYNLNLHNHEPLQFEIIPWVMALVRKLIIWSLCYIKMKSHTFTEQGFTYFDMCNRELIWYLM